MNLRPSGTLQKSLHPPPRVRLQAENGLTAVGNQSADFIYRVVS